MTPAETISRRLLTRLETAGVSVPIKSPLFQALEGERKTTDSSGVIISCHVTGQNLEPAIVYTFSVVATLCVSVDDDKSGTVFASNYAAIWEAFDFLARSDNCVELGDEDETTATHIFSADGFQITGGNEPYFSDDGNGGVWSTSFSATLTGRAKATTTTNETEAD